MLLEEGFFELFEVITTRIPILKTTYQVGKQVAMAFSLPEKQIFRKALLVEGFREGQWLIGFVTGEVEDPKKTHLCWGAIPSWAITASLARMCDFPIPSPLIRVW